MNTTKISRKQIAQLLGVSVTEAAKIHNSLINKGYIKPLNKDGAFKLSALDPHIAERTPYNPIKFTL